MSAAEFTRDKFDWLDGVASDAKLPGTSSRLAITLLRYMNRKTGDAWPSIPRLAADLAVSENTVRKSLKALVDGGHLKIEAGGGNRSNRYKMTAHPCNKLKGSPLHKTEGVKNSTPAVSEHRPLQFRDVDPCRKLNPNPIKEPKEEPIEGESLSPPDEKSSDEDFEEFFAAYPKPVKKDRARQAFRTARKAGASLADLIDGALSLKARRDAEEPDPNKRFRFTPDAHNWLANEGWRDPTPAASPAIVGNVVTLPTRRASAPDPMEMFRRAGLNPETLDMEGAS